MKQALSCLKNGMVVLVLVGAAFLHGAVPKEIGQNWNLPNLGNTCYQAAVLQALSRCPDIVDGLKELGVRTNGQQALLNLLQAITQQTDPKLREKTTDPTNFMSAFYNTVDKKQFSEGVQHDSKLFLSYLVYNYLPFPAQTYIKFDETDIEDYEKISFAYVSQDNFSNDITNLKIVSSSKKTCCLMFAHNILNLSQGNTATSKFDKSNFICTLLSVVIHSGESMNCGHYWCWIKENDGWYRYDDFHDYAKAYEKLSIKEFEDKFSTASQTERIAISFYHCTPKPQDPLRQALQLLKLKLLQLARKLAS